MSETLHALACRLLDLACKIERASSEDEENRLCDERDQILARFRATDCVIAALPVDNPHTRIAYSQHEKFVEKQD